MDNSGHCIWHRCQYGTGLDPIALRIFPAIPESCEGEQLAISFKEEPSKKMPVSHPQRLSAII
jgi:hypothetical protein